MEMAAGGPSVSKERRLILFQVWHAGGFNQTDSIGFIKINAIRLMADTAIKKKMGKA
jgi:hypothetical protein